ncbi:DUF1684 domain-containing protein [Myxococcus xanthus]|uniref:DUF1684 domain-containing protein n=1 Tax=Myxococcus xanthus TaxID=34 RepID=A0A7Y4MR41_MYXXA|nr:DUF1684 domain-containing protein [Myxococcus xanthus]NOJ79631.1 DUF1684 domain-containing protein [Myxococcus xanthus]NOJ85947.1 DUF1684 domain-containing protein [Myxococcus xanthus]
MQEATRPTATRPTARGASSRPRRLWGQVALHHNRAYSPTCAFSAYSLCPLPPRQNRLPLRVQTSEKRPQSQ